MLEFFSSNWKIDFVIIYTSLCQQQPRRRRYSSSMDGRGGDAVDNILFFSRFFTTLLYLWQNVMRFFFSTWIRFWQEDPGLLLAPFLEMKWFITTAVMFIKIFLVDLDLIWFEQIWCHWQTEDEKNKFLWYSEPNVATQF